MSEIIDLHDIELGNDSNMSFHNCRVLAHHVEMESILGTFHKPSGDGKCNVVWNFLFKRDDGQNFPVSVYDWKEYDDYFFRTNHHYNISTRTTEQSKLVAEYLESRLLDYMKTFKNKFYVDAEKLCKKIEDVVTDYVNRHNIEDIYSCVVKISEDEEISIGGADTCKATTLCEQLVFLLESGEQGQSRINLNKAKIRQLVREFPAFYYYQYLNSIQKNEGRHE